MNARDREGDEARRVVLDRLPSGVEVHFGKSKTLQDAGILEAIHDPTRFDALRPRYLKMDRQTQAREIRKLSRAPNYMLGSVNAITEDGVLVATSASSRQLGPYANTAGKVIPVVGSQKIVPDLEAALRRVREFVLPWDDARVRNVFPSGSLLGKSLLIEREWIDGRMTLVLVRRRSAFSSGNWLSVEDVSSSQSIYIGDLGTAAILAAKPST